MGETNAVKRHERKMQILKRIQDSEDGVDIIKLIQGGSLSLRTSPDTVTVYLQELFHAGVITTREHRVFAL